MHLVARGKSHIIIILSKKSLSLQNEAMKKNKINKLKILRLTLGIILTTLLTALFIDFNRILPTELHFIAHSQLIPAMLLAINGMLTQLLILIVLILLFGKLYCSTVCPLGILQDFIAWLSKKIIKKKRYKYTKPLNVLRYVFLFAMIMFFVTGFGSLAAILEPYSIFGRIAVYLFKPVVLGINNLLAFIFELTGDYYFIEEEIFVLSTLFFVITLISFLIVGVLSFLMGRKFCNTICPVGTLLGLASRFSLFKIRINKEKCNTCGLCEHICKAECINSKAQSIDLSRCVVCFNCIGKCNKDAIRYGVMENVTN